MTELEKGYIAGIIDGEGSICLTKSGKWRHPTIQISSTTYEMLEYVAALFQRKQRMVLIANKHMLIRLTTKEQFKFCKKL